MTIRKNQRRYDDPIRHAMHPRPRTRREFLAQGFIGGTGVAIGSPLLNLLPTNAYADLDALIAADCPSLANLGGGKIPFIGFDLAGGCSTSNSNVLVGGPLGQEDMITTAGYERQGLPGDMVPSATNTTNPQPGRTDHINDELGLLFHSDSAFLRGILAMTSDSTRQNTDGCIIAARSDNDTANNPHNPMGGIAAYGANGELTQLVGSENTASGGNSVGPAMMVPLGPTPTKVDRRTDVTGLVDVGDLKSVLTDPADVNAVMESIYRVSRDKVGKVKGEFAPDPDEIELLVRCGYLKSAKLAKEFSDPIDPFLDTEILALRDTFVNEMNALNGDPREREFEKTASVMKLVLNGYAGAGTIEMGGYDYHGGARSEGEQKDFRAGLCMGACLEYAATRPTPTPLMMYVFSDGSLSSNGVIDNSTLGRGKLEWSSDNGSTAATWFLVYNPGPNPTPVLRRQIGWMRPNGSVETNAHPGAANVNLLAEMVVLNYLALHGDQGQLHNVLPFSGLNSSMLDNWIGIGNIT